MTRWLLLSIILCSCGGSSTQHKQQRAAAQVAEVPASERVEGEPEPELDVAGATASTVAEVEAAFLNAERISSRIAQSAPKGPMTAQSIEAPIEVARPKKTNRGCVTTTEWHRYNDERAARDKVREHRLAEKKGWKRLVDMRRMQGGLGERDADAFGGLMAQKRDDGFIDPLGNHWVLIDRSSACFGLNKDAYIDADANVFLVQPEYGECKSRRNLRICGTLGMRGCGREPPETRVYVRVPADAKIAPPRFLRLPDRTCYEPRPENGVTVPG